MLIQDPGTLATWEVTVENRLLHFPISSVSWVFGLPEENVNCVAMMETAWKLLRDPNENHLNDSATPVLGNEVSILKGYMS